MADTVMTETRPEKMIRKRSTAVARARTPMEMLERAIANGMAPEVIKQLMDLQERHERNEAKRQFDRAIAAAKGELPVILKTKKVGYVSKKPGAEPVGYTHETMAEIARVVDPILAKYELGYRYRSVVNGQVVVMTCILFHAAGHAEETSLPGPFDNTGNKNALQQMGSTATYLQRYTLKIALGLAAADNDDDARATTIEMLSEQQIEAVEKHILATGANREKLFQLLKIESLANVQADQYQDLMKSLDIAKKRRDALAAQVPEVEVAP